PAYMSPEQARGDVEQLDARSDLYSAAVMLHEFVTLRHYLADETTVEGLFKSILTPDDVNLSEQGEACPAQKEMPAELMYIATRGMVKSPDKRAYPTATAFVAELQRVLAGTFAVDCKTTMIKRLFRELARAVDKHPALMFYSFVGVCLTILFTLVEVVRLLVTS
ncbi:MAG TPA: hypothetical protein PKA58_19620, partial [Polyangium sp.]|nr:hypothetical protein [Polyangium sp.]